MIATAMAYLTRTMARTEAVPFKGLRYAERTYYFMLLGPPRSWKVLQARVDPFPHP